MGKYRDSGLLFLDTRELYLLNENLCQDLMQIALRSRNNDLEFDDAIAIFENGNAAAARAARDHIITRLERTAANADIITERLTKHLANPEGYDEPQLTW